MGEAGLLEWWSEVWNQLTSGMTGIARLANVLNQLGETVLPVGSTVNSTPLTDFVPKVKDDRAPV